MARLSSSDVTALLKLNPDFLAYLQGEALSLTPLVQCQDVTVLPTATSATLELTLNAAPRDTIIGSWQTRNGTGTNQGVNYTAASGPIIWQPGEALTKQITIQLSGNNKAGNSVQVLIGGTIAGGKVGPKGVGNIFFADTLNPPASGLTLTFQQDFTQVVITPTGKDTNGNGCWQSTLDKGRRTQPGNAEMGYYGDPSVVPACVPSTIDQATGKFALQANSFPNGVLDANGNVILNPSNVVNGVQQPFRYTSAVINSFHFPAAQVPPNSRVESSIAMPINGSVGLWPAFWLLPMSGAWPPEIDMMEWPTVGTVPNGYNPWTFFTTQHSPSGTGGDNRRGYPIDIRNWGITSDLTNFHTYGITILDTGITFDLDGIPYVQMENHSPGQTFYILYDITVGGWPGNPNASTVFPAKMLIDWLKIYSVTIG